MEKQSFEDEAEKGKSRHNRVLVGTRSWRSFDSKSVKRGLFSSAICNNEILHQPSMIRSARRTAPMLIQNRLDTTADTRRLHIAFVVALSFALLLWVLKLAEYVGGFDFSQFGIYPRRADGLIGILCAPFIHGSVSHLFANTAPIIVIGTMLLYGYPRAAKVLLPVVYLGGGGAVWLFAREAYHIGASGLAFGMLFFVSTIGVIRWERRTIALSLVVLFLYGGMIWGVIPGAHDVSFESHLSGALIGIVLAFLLRNHDPESPRKQYSWEEDETETDDYDWPDRL